MKFVYAYADYRDFVRDYIAAQVAAGQRLSARSISTKARLGPPNYLGLILEGKRRLSLRGALALAALMGLVVEETKYFVALVCFCEAKDQTEREFHQAQLDELRVKKPKASAKVLSEELSYDWRVPIALLLALDQSRDRAALAISRQLKLKISDAEALLDRMTRAGLLKNEARFEMSESYLAQRDPKALKKSSAEFLRQHTRLLSRSLERRYSPNAKHIVQVVGSLASRKSALFSILEETSEKCAQLVATDTSEEVYVMHLHCVPLKTYLA